MIDHFIRINNLRFHYLEWPRDGAPVMLLVHGFSGHALTWDVFAESMARRFRVIALDQRGHGDSDWADEYGTEHSVSDLREFIAALDLHQITLVAHSMGARNSMVYLNREPARVAKFVIVDIGPELSTAGGTRIRDGWQNSQDVFDSPEEAFAQLRAVNQRPPLEHHRTRVYHSLKQLPDGQWTWKYDKKLRTPGGQHAPHALITTADWWRMWQNIACPTLLVRGGLSDLLSPETAQKMTETNRHCTLVEIPGAGHSVPMDRPAEFEAAVREWLQP
ncbi:MAG: alpha/beta hydrolase [Chloroflexi bacterium]|nr:alpha/beta hydrolase [Chloroflexota bacterium]